MHALSRLFIVQIPKVKTPILWKTIAQGFFRSLLSTVFTLVAILITTKIEDIAKFISLGAGLFKIILFVAFQIPYLVQIAIPISAVWAAYTYFSQLNSDHQITALRALGFSIKDILYPLGISGAILGLLMFSVLFDFGASCHLGAKKLEFDVRLAEPLALVHTSQHMRGSDVAFDLKGSLKRGEHAQDLFVCLNRTNGGLALVLAKDLYYHDSVVDATTATVITATPIRNTFADLMIENAKTVETPSEHLYELTGARGWKISEEHLPLRILLARREELSQEIAQDQLKGASSKVEEKKRERIYSEIARRASLALACFTLTLLGAASAITIGRRDSNSSALHCVLYVTFFVVFYLAAKSVDELAFIAVPLFILPHIILWKLYIKRVHTLEMGVV